MVPAAIPAARPVKSRSMTDWVPLCTPPPRCLLALHKAIWQGAAWELDCARADAERLSELEAAVLRSRGWRGLPREAARELEDLMQKYGLGHTVVMSSAAMMSCRPGQDLVGLDDAVHVRGLTVRCGDTRVDMKTSARGPGHVTRRDVVRACCCVLRKEAATLFSPGAGGDAVQLVALEWDAEDGVYVPVVA